MKERIRMYFQNHARLFRTALIRFPEAILCALVAAILLMVMNHQEFHQGFDNTLGRTIRILILAVPVFLSLKTVAERVDLRRLGVILSEVIAAIPLVFYGVFGLGENMTGITRYIALNLTAWAVYLVVPYFHRRKGFSRYGVYLAIRVFVTGLYAGVLFLGMASIVAAVNLLFDLHIQSRIYLDLFLASAGWFAPVFFLAHVPAVSEDIQEDKYPKVFRGLILYIVMPLMTVYGAVLYAYFAKVLVTASWPSGRVVHLTLWFALLMACILIAAKPLRASSGWGRSFLNFAPLAMLPLCAVMFTALFQRLSDYGLTEPRYLVLVGGIWVTGVLLTAGIRKLRNTLWIPVTAALVTLIAISGPWSMYNVSMRSQNARFEALLSSAGMLREGHVHPADKEPDADTKTELEGILNYFGSEHTLSQLKALPVGYTSADASRVFGFDLYAQGEPGDNRNRRWFSFNTMSANSGRETRGTDAFFRISMNTVSKAEAADVQAVISGQNVVVTAQDKSELTFSLKDAAAMLLAKYPQDKQLSEKDDSFTAENSALRVIIVIQDISGSQSPGVGLTVESASVQLWVTKKAH